MSDNDASGRPEYSSDKQTVAARQMVAVMLSVEQNLSQKVAHARVSPRPMDMTEEIIKVLAAQSRCLAFILTELLEARGEPRMIHFVDRPEEGVGNGKSKIALVTE